ncbi:MAG: O-antigen ligase family protein [Pyrinomonadaceae bacterium]
MTRFFEQLDDLASITGERGLPLWLDRAIFVFLVLTFVSAPHSIAATQIAWLTGMAIWFLRLAVRPRPKLSFRWIDAALWAFFVWSAITSVFSYAPDISIDKLRGTAIFLIFYFAYYNLRSRRAVYFLSFAMIVSCMVNVAWTPVQRWRGRGVEVSGVAPGGPLGKALLWNGDTLLEADGVKISTPDALAAAVENKEITKVKVYRPDYYFTVDVKRSDLLVGESSAQKLGFLEWKKSRNWRSTGFYGHYTTYAEVLQLIGSLAFGLLVAALLSRRKRANKLADAQPPSLGVTVGLVFAIAGIALALLLTVTRASQLAFMISSAFVVVIGAGRRWLLAALGIGLPIVVVGLLFLQQSRQVGFFDANDDSIKWRETVWHEGFDLWKESPRHMIVGVGMDSIKRYADEWRLFDEGRLPVGHFHSTPLQLLVERGIPALLIWLWILGIYIFILRRGLLRNRAINADWKRDGILLGCLGGAIGFFASGLVHYNLGDQEVAMAFFLLMALGLRAAESFPETVVNDT